MQLLSKEVQVWGVAVGEIALLSGWASCVTPTVSSLLTENRKELKCN